MSHETTVLFREFWGTSKRADLLNSLAAPDFDSTYEHLEPKETNRFALRPGVATADYAAWPSLPDLSAITPLNGLMEKRGGALIDSDRAALEARMRVYLDRGQPMEAVRRVAPGLVDNRARFNAVDARDDAQGEGFVPDIIKRYWLRPFEPAWAYTTLIRPVWNEPRPNLQHVLPDAGGFLISRAEGVANPEGFLTSWTPCLPDNDGLRGHAQAFPTMENLSGASQPNLSAIAVNWLADLGLEPDQDSSSMVWHHALAITYAPAYLADHAAGIRQGWPRIPLPADAALLRRSAALGAQLSALLDPDAPVDGVTHGKIRPELAAIAVPHGHDYALTAGWGTRTGKGITMPGRGRISERAYAETESATAGHAILLGASTRDVYINDESYWANIPATVWETHIGGYQVIKKWLSYREKSITNRALKPDEVLHVTQTARRLAAILLLGPELDESYRACAAAHTA